MRTLKTLLAGTGLILALTGAANAAVVATATTITEGDSFVYAGLGANPDNGLGTGRVRLGDCSFDAASDTTACVLAGAFEGDEDGAAVSGTFRLTQLFPGDVSTHIGQSTPANPDEFFFIAINSGFFGIEVSFDDGRTVSGLFPDFADRQIGFNLVSDDAVCTGLADDQACGIASVGLTVGAVFASGLDAFTFSLPDALLDEATMDPSAVPVPGALALFAPILAAGAWRRVRRG